MGLEEDYQNENKEQVPQWSSPLNRQTKFTDKNCKLEYEKA